MGLACHNIFNILLLLFLYTDSQNEACIGHVSALIMMQHEDDYICDICEHGFIDRSEYILHRDRHFKDKEKSHRVARGKIMLVFFSHIFLTAFAIPCKACQAI